LKNKLNASGKSWNNIYRKERIITRKIQPFLQAFFLNEQEQGTYLFFTRKRNGDNAYIAPHILLYLIPNEL